MAMTRPISEQVTFTQEGAGAVERLASEKLREWVSVKDFGAVGDGVTDDTAAIQAAIDAAAARSACVIFPAGEYIFTEVVVTNLQNVSMSGEGSGSVLRGTVSLVGIGSTIPGSVYRIDITRVCFHGIDKDTSVGIKCEYTWQCRISNCTFKNLLKGVSIVAHSIRDYIEDNFFEEVSFPLYQENSIRSADISFTRNQITPNAIRSIVFQSMDGFSICENTFFASPVAGVTRNHVYVANLTDETLSHNNWVRIQNNTFFECGNPSVANLPSDGAVVFDGDNVYESQVIITGNLFGWCFQPIRIAGMAVRPSSPNGGVIIADNYIEQQFDKRGECHPIYVANVNKTLDVRGNSIYKTGGNAANTYDAIRVENCTHPRVIANFILNEGVTTHRHGVGFQDCSTPMAALNTIFGSGTADVFGGIKQANITSAVTAKMKGVAWASCIFIYSNSTVSYFEGRFNLSIARKSQGLWVVTFDSSAPSNDTPVPFVVANEALCRIVGSPGPEGFSFETINTTGSRIDPAGAISVAAV